MITEVREVTVILDDQVLDSEVLDSEMDAGRLTDGSLAIELCTPNCAGHWGSPNDKTSFHRILNIICFRVHCYFMFHNMFFLGKILSAR